METKEIVKLTAGIFVLIAAVGITYYIVEGDQAYYCENENTVGLCFKLSKVNADGFQTRCYYNESNPTKYNYCKSGWNVYKNQNVTGEPLDESFDYIDINFTSETISKLNAQNISEVQVGPCIQTKPNLCIAILNISEDVFKELLINPSLYNTTEELELKIIEEAKKELAKLVAEEPEVFKLTNQIKINLKEI